MKLEFENVNGKSRKFALKDISFQLEDGYIMGLAGKNGAGKTTLIDYIMNPKCRYTGTIRVDGEDIRNDRNAMLNKVGFVSEDNIFFEEYSIGDNELLLKGFYDNWDHELFNKMIDELKVPRKVYLKNLSRGEKIKFQLAFAMAHHPVLYLMDEATAGMDPVFRVDFFNLLQKLMADENTSILMTSHIEEEMYRKTDYVGILEKGQLSAFGESLDILKE